MENKDFYNSLADVYDEMIDFDAALKRRIDLLSNIAGSYKTAADLGCGTGIDSIALSSLGLKVDAFDLSEQMINRAKENAVKYNAAISFNNCALEKISESNQTKYYLIVSLGNTLANLDENQLRKTLKICDSKLKEDGQLVIQILNYNIVKEDIHLVNEKETDEYHVTRYYEKTENGLLFKIKIIDKLKRDEHIIETPIYPHDLKLIIQICNDLNMRANFFGGLDLSQFDKSTSKDLVVVAEKKRR